ncbi:selenocysteine insertion sequence-binding protein 2-like isoform X2 [Gigantopelta aegis]|uniref:selenocysteine insertion sequence-binding protein 2-like isoform X2 n=1 Tax=Gigantopelta aegis TaxID=1735272 RepID=UPI001B889ED8|nr:selenocysteine insertion sequence-binding protein 2-like isoform X2 [Gigantopelta aegis]
MADTPQCQPTSSLSASAAEFVPGRCFTNPIGLTSVNDSILHPVTEVPAFVTSCYPFVTGDQGSGGLWWHNRGRGSGRPYSGRGKQNRPRKFIPPTNHWAAPLITSLPPSFVPTLPTVAGIPFDGGTDIGDGLLPTPQLPPSVIPAFIHPAMNGAVPLRGMGVHVPAFVNRGRGRVKTGHQFSNRFPPKAMNEEYSHYQEAGSQGIDPWPSDDGAGRTFSNSWLRNKTIILKDVSAQTDFPDTWANLTLSDKPNSLYKHSRGCVRRVDLSLTSDSEEVDSDSGYSSPLHRRNMRSNGTHPVCASERGVCAIVSSESSRVVQNAPDKLSYANVAQHSTSLRCNNLQDASINIKHPEREICDRGLRNLRGGITSPDRTSVARCERKKSGEICDQTIAENDDITDVNGGGDDGKKKQRRRNRRRKKKSKDDDDTQSDGLSVTGRTFSSSNLSRTSDVTLYFEDEEEFPHLLHNNVSSRDNGSNSTMSYSQAAKASHVTVSVRDLDTSGHSAGEFNGLLDEVAEENMPVWQVPTGSQQQQLQQHQQQQSQQQLLPESKCARKRRKRRELANRAAEEELAEITLEQQMLKEFKLKQPTVSSGVSNTPNPVTTATPTMMTKVPMKVVKQTSIITDEIVVRESQKQQGSGKKSKQPLLFDFALMIDNYEKKKVQPVGLQTPEVHVKKIEDKQGHSHPHNILDSSAPVKRGKERENPKPKKPSPLKKVILKEREEKKKMRLLDGDLVGPLANTTSAVGVGVVNAESDLSQDGISSKSSIEMNTGQSTSADLSPISQNSPISMSPLSPGASPLSSEMNSPIASGKEHVNPALLKIHSRRFREYCNQVLDKEIDTCATSLLQELVRFQDRMFHKDPAKAKLKRRIVLGLREVTKHLKLKKIKCVIISPNLEKIQSKGGLDDALNNILNYCQEQNVPFVFALGRRALGRACAKLVPVSVCGIFNYEGCEETFRKLFDLTEKAREAYTEMVQSIRKELEEHQHRVPPSSFPNLFAHMGHSRTPSGCSAISFASSVLSEPISENYPHSEPETDSKGYEIIKDEKSDKPSRSPMLENGMRAASIPSAVHEIDDGNEADDEDCNDVVTAPPEDVKEMVMPSVKPVIINNVDSSCDDDDDDDDDDDENLEDGNDVDDDDEEEDADEDTESESTDSQHVSDTVEDLPHIDSIHNVNYEPGTEILSQHSGRTLDSSEVMSTHSSRTVGDGSSTMMADHHSDRPKTDITKLSDSPTGTPTQHRIKLMDNKDRIQSWVDQSPNCLGGLEEVSAAEEAEEESSSTTSDVAACTGSESEVEVISVSETRVSLNGGGEGAATTTVQDRKRNAVIS